jgi:serine/threonine protein phosphatase PrpC
LQEQIDSGMITARKRAHSQNKNLVTRALGVDPRSSRDPRLRCDAGDIYLLCSDGLNDMVEDEEIALTLQALGQSELAATQLVQMANDNGGRDNVSVVLVRIAREFRRRAAGGLAVLQWFK